MLEVDAMEDQTKHKKLAAEGHVSLALRGIILAFISGLFNSGASAVVKYLNNIYPAQLAAYRFWCVFSFSWPQIIWMQEHILGPPAHRLSTLVMAFGLAIEICLICFAFRYLPLGEAAVLCGSYPAFVTISGKVFLKESLGILHIIALLATIAGLILTAGLHQTITENSFTMENINGIAASLGVVATMTISFIICRKTEGLHYSVILFNAGILGVIGSVVLTAFLGNISFYYGGLERVLIILLGFLSYVAFICAFASLRYAEAGSATIVKSSAEIFFAFVSQVIIFGDVPETGTIAGAILVCISITLLGIGQKYWTLMPKQCLNLF